MKYTICLRQQFIVLKHTHLIASFAFSQERVRPLSRVGEIDNDVAVKRRIADAADERFAAVDIIPAVLR